MGWMFRSGDSNEPMMWWTKGWHWCSPTVRCRSVVMAIFPECIFCDVGHHWDVRLEGLQDSIVKSAPSVWTAPQSFLYSLRTNRFLFFRIWKHAVCAKDLEALLLLRCHCHNKNALFFSQRKLKMKEHRPNPSAVNKIKRRFTSSPSRLRGAELHPGRTMERRSSNSQEEDELLNDKGA